MELPLGGRRRRFTLSGLWIAAIGFFVTRFTVTLAAFDDRLQFLLAGVIPLLLGLSLAAFGVAMLVSSVDRSFVRSVAAWCTAGTAAMAGLVAITLVATSPVGAGPAGPVRSDVVLANFMIGGAVLGALTGVYAGANRRHREQLRRQATRMVTINRLLRHEVLNAIGIIRGRAETLGAEAEPFDADTLEPIFRESDRIVDTVEGVKHLARSSGAGLDPVDLLPALEGSVEAVREEHPDVTIETAWDVDAPVEVWADGQLRTALYPLIENAAAYDDSAEPRVVVAADVDAGRGVARVRVVDSGPGLPEEQRATLERGSIGEFDDPGAGFGTQVARLFVEGYGGDIRTEVSASGTTVEVELRLASENRPAPTEARSVRSVGVDRGDLLVAVGASIVAGAVMGLYVQWAAGVIPVIGALYGVSDPIVGWITHEFHSVVFGLVFVGMLAQLPGERGERPVASVALAVAWSLALWIVAAGVIMPAWLNLVGIPAPIPSVSAASLVGHLLWGVTVAAGYHLGTSRLDRRRRV